MNWVKTAQCGGYFILLLISVIKKQAWQHTLMTAYVSHFIKAINLWKTGSLIRKERFLLQLKHHTQVQVTMAQLDSNNNSQQKDTGLINTSDSLLIDRFGRQITYLRISITDRCDLRCVYCMAEDMQFVPRSQLLTLEEVVRIGSVFVDLGVSKLRITGGEPLTRNNMMFVFRQLGALEHLHDFTLTTNGTQLGHYAGALRDAGVTRVNISLDSPIQKKHDKMRKYPGCYNKVIKAIGNIVKNRNIPFFK